MGDRELRLRHRARIAVRSLSHRARSLPSFLIIGAQRSGTTSLHSYLTAHPQVAAPLRKEIHFFTNHFAHGEQWYRAHFPRQSSSTFTFESTPYYLFHPLVPSRVHDLMPNVRLIVLLRNPIDRALSHYLLNVHLGQETLSFEDALKSEAERLAPGQARLADDRDPDTAFQRYSYASRGLYAEQLVRWLQHFPRNRLYIDTAERLFQHPRRVLGHIEQFLEIETQSSVDFSNASLRTSPGDSPLSMNARSMLEERFQGPNLELSELVGLDPCWR